MFKTKQWLASGFGIGLVAVCALFMAAGVNGVFNNVTANGTINSVGGYKFAGGAGIAGQTLCSNGTVFNTLCSPGQFYQTVEWAGVAQNQRAAFDFGSEFTLSDSASPSKTIVHIAGTSRTCNANGCYVQLSDGTIHAWGISSLVAGTPNSTVLTIVYPITFSSTPNPVVTPVAAPAGGGGPCSGFSCPVTCNAIRTSLSTTGASVGMSWATVNASGYANLSAGDYCAWSADGN